jgi:uncharacterized protein (TIGR02598 family)
MRAVKKNRMTSGFSLPEVLIAVVIATVGITIVLGVLPGSLASMRKANDDSSHARIAQKLIAEINLADWGVYSGGKEGTWSGLSAALDKTYFFDDQAIEIARDDEESLIQRLNFVAKLRRAVPVDTSGYPTGQARNGINMNQSGESVRFGEEVQVVVVTSVDKNIDLNDPEIAKNGKLFTGIVCRQNSSQNSKVQ